MKTWLKAEIYDRWHLWASVWTILLLTWSIVYCSIVDGMVSEGVVVALVSLEATMYGVTGAVHGWKETTRTKTQPASLGFKPK